ncbi:pirin family protein [Stenotrophomonas maltophilia]|nr:pirin family protein [Stenotrophomonas maltophilia]RRU14517.1 pirin family protein [Stenotrophomonas maltophilia]RRU36885.1 pirin family protein [Stenotrophomonas maltophilia]RRU88571.1 pirin family protein [Stenotrophomonas maltophilia]RRV01471.1 pirin family protein [Stenotrophomonas maltophilia]
MKRVTGTYSAPRPHWVGDGFPARSMFSYNTHGQHLSPFLLLDYAGPYSFAPSDTPRGVGQHPHRGFETVTIVYEGEVAHRDSTGAGGTIGPGDVQWMTAASGILHEEFHTPEFSRRGGTLDMVQLWVNLPAQDKMGAPGYQTLLDAQIPSVELPDGAGRVRVIAGRFDNHAGPARTHTPMDVWDIRLRQGHHAELPVADGRTLALVVLKGTARINSGQPVGEAQLVTFDRSGEDVFVDADSDATVLLLSGEPIDEPVVGYGPFVMNSQAEIAQAVNDFNSGRFGQIAH